jgi:hypothetical protein
VLEILVLLTPKTDPFACERLQVWVMYAAKIRYNYSLRMKMCANPTMGEVFILGLLKQLLFYLSKTLKYYLQSYIEPSFRRPCSRLLSDPLAIGSCSFWIILTC